MVQEKTQEPFLISDSQSQRQTLSSAKKREIGPISCGEMVLTEYTQSILLDSQIAEFNKKLCL